MPIPYDVYDPNKTSWEETLDLMSQPRLYEERNKFISPFSARPAITPKELTRLNQNKGGGLFSSIKGGFKSGDLNAPISAGIGMVSKAISDGYESGAGSVMSTLGQLGSAIPGPAGVVFSAIGQFGGAAVDRLFGTKVNQERLNAANQGTNYLNNFNSDASYFDGIEGPKAQLGVANAYKSGLLNGGSAKKKNLKLRQQRAEADEHAWASVENNINNIATTQMDNALANYSAYGGLLDMRDYGNKGGLYDLALRNRGLALDILGNQLAEGGLLNTNGANWTNGVTAINAGGTHEANPYEGVQMGIAQDGKPNLVEEGEVIWNDYVFSNRIRVPKALRSKYKLRNNKNATFADIAKKLQKESLERPNDPISKKGLNVAMSSLAMEQEQIKQLMAARDAANERAEQADILGSIFANGGQITIKPSKRGTFTAEALKHNMTVQEFADEVLSNPDSYSTEMIKKANFARNAHNWKHAYGGLLGSNGLIEDSHKFPNGGGLKGSVFSIDDARKWVDELDEEDYLELLTNSLGEKHSKFNNFKKNRKEFVNYAISGKRGSGYYGLHKGYTDYLNSHTLARYKNSRSLSPDFRHYLLKNPNAAKDIIGLLDLKPRSTDYKKYPEQQKLDQKYNSIATYLSNLDDVENINSLMDIYQTKVDKMNVKPDYQYGSDEFKQAAIVDAIGEVLSSGQTIKSKDKDGNDISTTYYNQSGDIYDKLIKYYDDIVSEATKDKPIYDLLDKNTKEYIDGIYDLSPNRFKNKEEVARYLFNTSNYSIATEEAGKVKEAFLKNYVPGMADLEYKWDQNNQGQQGMIIADRQSPVSSPAKVDAKIAPIDIKLPKTPNLKFNTEEENQNDKLKKLIGLRFAPAIGSSLAAFTDLLGLTNKPDYSNAESILQAANNGKSVRFTPIGNMMEYTPFDRLFYANQLGAQANALRRNILNTSGGNRGVATAGLLAGDFNNQTKLGELYRQGEEFNSNLYERALNYNKDTAKFNSEGFLKADIANKDKDKLLLEAATQAAKMRDDVDARVSQAKSANLTNLFDSIGNIGLDAYNRYDRNWLLASGWSGTLPYGATPADWNEGMNNFYRNKVKPKVVGGKGSSADNVTAAYGGKITRKKKRGLTI